MHREPQGWGKVCPEGLGRGIAQVAEGKIWSPLPADCHCRDLAGLGEGDRKKGDDFSILEEKAAVS